MKRAAFVAGFIAFVAGALLPQESDLPGLPGPYLGQKPLSGRQKILFGRPFQGKKTDIYWASAKTIEELRPKGSKIEEKGN